MPNLARIVRLTASPCFLLLALFLHSDADVVLQFCGLAGSSSTTQIFGQAVELPMGSLGSMWFMYLLMAVFHSGPWMSLLTTEKVDAGCCEDGKAVLPQ